MRGAQVRHVILVLLCASFAVAGLIVRSNYLLHLLIMFFIYCALAISWNAVKGFGGQLSLMQQGFFGSGMYALGLLTLAGYPFFLAFPATALVGLLLGALLAYVLRNVKGLIYGVAGLMIVEGIQIVITNVDAWGGTRGLILPISAQYTKLPFYYGSFILFAAALWLTYGIMRSRHGLAIVASRDDEQAAEMMGVNTLKYKIYLLALSAVFTACAGGIFGLYNTFIEPNSSFDFLWMLDVLIMVEFGGSGTFLGPIVGCTIYFILTEVIRYQYGLYHLLFGGLFLMVIALFFKEGVWGSLIKRYPYLKFLDIE